MFGPTYSCKHIDTQAKWDYFAFGTCSRKAAGYGEPGDMPPFYSLYTTAGIAHASEIDCQNAGCQ
jgi:hypothetical protein